MDEVERPIGLDPIRWVSFGLALVVAAFVATLVVPKDPGHGLVARVVTFSLIALSLAAVSVVRGPRADRLRFALVAGWLLIVVFFASGAVMSKVRKPAPPVVGVNCLSNVKQLTLAVLMYNADFDDRYPLAESWRTETRPYAREMFACPSAKAPWSYALQDVVAGIWATKQRAPADTVLIFEADGYDRNIAGGCDWFAQRHGGKGTVSYCDGHANWRSIARIVWGLR